MSRIFKGTLIKDSGKQGLLKTHKASKRRPKQLVKNFSVIQAKDHYEFSSVFPNEETMRKAYAVMQKNDAKNAEALMKLKQ